MKLLVEGAYTINSAGDDAALEALLSLLKKKMPSAPVDVRVLSRHPGGDFDEAFGVKTIQNFEYSTKEESLDKWLRGFNYGDSQEIILDVLEQFEWADLVILGAGNFINENSFGLFRGMLSRFCISSFFAKITKTPCMLYGLSASVLRSRLAIKMASWLFNNVSMTTFREYASYNLLKNLGIRMPEETKVLPDPVLLSSCTTTERIQSILGREKIPARTSKPRLALSVREFYHRGRVFHEQYLDNVRSAVDLWTSNGGEVLCIPQCTYAFDRTYADDRHIAASLWNSLHSPEQVYLIQARYWPWEIEGLYSVCDAALCSRLHAGVFSCKQAVPTVSFAYEPKVQGYWEQLGITEYCLPVESKGESIYMHLEKALSNFPMQEVQERLTSLKGKTRHYGDIVFELLG